MGSGVLHKVTLIVPTYRPGAYFSEFLQAYERQSRKPEHAVMVDSGSGPGIKKWGVERYGFETRVIDKSEFNHGGTRQKALEYYPDSDIVVFMTQDAILASSDALENLIGYLSAADTAAVCGRQLPRQGAGPIEAHARLFNYPDSSIVRTLDDRKRLGLKVAFLSNSFAAYSVSALKEIGGFPDSVIFGEDMYVAAKLLKAGYKIAYSADACVYHSHAYTVCQEFARYFDMGVFHAGEEWLIKEFGMAEKQGARFMRSETKYLREHAFWQIPEALLRSVVRYAGYKTGSIEQYIPLKIKKKISMNPGYFI